MDGIFKIRQVSVSSSFRWAWRSPDFEIFAKTKHACVYVAEKDFVGIL